MFNAVRDKFVNSDWQENKLVDFLAHFERAAGEQVRTALDLAKQEHAGQMRDEGSPYIIHPVRTALILLEELDIRGAELVCAALLHDAVEDGSVTVDGITSQFGQEVGRIVDGLTRPRPTDETEQEKAKNKLKKISEIAGADEKIRLVKLCDTIDNTRSQCYIAKSHPSYQKIPRWNKELRCYLPIAKCTHPTLFEILDRYIKP